MGDDIRYYSIVGRGRSATNPSGLARRRAVGNGFVDESLHRDMSWQHTSAIAEWDRGEELSRDLVEISEQEAERLIERFREKWSEQG